MQFIKRFIREQKILLRIIQAEAVIERVIKTWEGWSSMPPECESLLTAYENYHRRLRCKLDENKKIRGKLYSLVLGITVSGKPYDECTWETFGTYKSFRDAHAVYCKLKGQDEHLRFDPDWERAFLSSETNPRTLAINYDLSEATKTTPPKIATRARFYEATT